MKTFVTWRRLNPDTINGEQVEIKMVCSSVNDAEIEAAEAVLKVCVGSGVMGEGSVDQLIEALKGVRA